VKQINVSASSFRIETHFCAYIRAHPSYQDELKELSPRELKTKRESFNLQEFNKVKGYLSNARLVRKKCLISEESGKRGFVFYSLFCNDRANVCNFFITQI